MSYKVITIPKFEKELKRLAKKYNSLKKEYFDLVQSLKEHPEQGTSISNNCYKNPYGNRIKRKGESGGARVLTYVKVIEESVYLLTIFDKSDQENIPDHEILELLKWIPE